MQEPPTRTTRRTYPCHCLLTYEDQVNPCTDFTGGPDQPFCGHCETRHPELDEAETNVSTYRHNANCGACVPN